MLAKFRSAVSKSRRRQRKLDRRRALHRSLRPEPLEGRLLLSGDSWVVPTETPFSGSYTSEVDTDSSGNVYLATSVDGGAATGADLFLAKYLPSGVEDWSHSFPVPDNQAVWTATVGSDGFYVTGGFMGTMDFDPTEGEAVLSESAGRYYLAKYSLAGEFR